MSGSGDPVLEGRTCGDCRWSDPNVLDENPHEPSLDRLVLLCRRFPPQPLGFDEDGVGAQLWPQVMDVDWCGEWAPKVTS